MVHRLIQLQIIGAAITGLALGDIANAAELWTPLFDGETFDGWEGNLEMFRIEDNCIVAGTLDQPIPRNEFLCTRRTYSDFELELQVMTKGKDANAGIQFRTARIPDHHEVIGYQADVGPQCWGRLYDESRRRRFLSGPPDTVDMTQIVKQDKWNDYRIRCVGRRVQLWLNDVLTVDFTETDESIDTSGVIAVQIHSGPPTEAWYRNLKLKDLSTESRTNQPAAE